MDFKYEKYIQFALKTMIFKVKETFDDAFNL